jgi:hypothetical protein
MIGDDHLTKEEVELAISRSKIVAKEFEMLLGQVSVKLPEPKVTEKAEPLPTGSTVVLEPDPIVKAESEPEEPLVILPVEPAGIPFVFPIAEYQFPDVVPEVEQQENPVVAVPEPEKVLPRSSFFRPLREEPPALNIDLKREDNSLFKPTPIKSLKEGLILNDRYLFQRELFNNDKSRLDETVAALDRLSNIHEAVEYLKANFRWTKSEASEKFVQLVKRRFSEPKG